MFLNLLFAIFLVVLVGQDPRFVHDDVILDLFGDIFRALFTTFQIATMSQWSAVVRVTVDKGGSAALPISLLCIVASSLVLLNIVTAVVIHQVFTSSQKDEELEQRQKEAKRMK